MLIVVHVSVDGSYLPPVSALPEVPNPPHTIISVPVHTAVCSSLAEGAPVVLIAVHVSVDGSYLPPVSVLPEVSTPPHTTISVPVHTAV